MLSGLWRERNARIQEYPKHLKTFTSTSTKNGWRYGTASHPNELPAPLRTCRLCFARECTVKYRKEDTVVKDRY